MAAISQTLSGPFPILPPELEMQIFLLAAKTYRGTSAKLILVAHRVLEWLEPFIYGTVVLRGKGQTFRFLNALYSRPPSFAHQRVKSVCLRQSIPLDLAGKVLSLCTGITNLALWITPQAEGPSLLLPLLEALPLTSVSLNLPSVMGPADSREPLSNQPLFSRLERLDLVNHWALWTSSLGIERLQRLTHTSFRFWARGNVGSALKLILREARSLEVLVLLSDRIIYPEGKTYLEKEDIRDARVVVMMHRGDAEQWIALERGEEGIWERATSVVRWRKRMGAGVFDLPPDFLV
ncbi:hypothetical protein BJ138DRAFT_1112833 [Hygrophoropsis aurantiaca]|uniref:Uncharacterized protein n=1 Tax=Hygrophoropsis aurantiaca TaxID=72124 RepID=A0ACB8AFD7_9AGAM|nr:hypothetical protein BJ138DRAFT_1112833 [Hygrophoropsis aurantiaca]